MKKSEMKKTGMIFAALLLLGVLPVSSMAAKGTVSGISTPSNAEAYSDEDELPDGDILDDVTASPSDAEEEPEEFDEAPILDDITATPANAEKTGKEAPGFAGCWTADGVTTYLFDEDGTGALILPEHRYPFSWTTDGDRLTLEFEDSSIGGIEFTITVSSGTLTMEREVEYGTAEFKLEKNDG